MTDEDQAALDENMPPESEAEKQEAQDLENVDSPEATATSDTEVSGEESQIVEIDEKQKALNKLAFEKSEQEFQKYADWPGLKPGTVDPIKVLEAQ